MRAEMDEIGALTTAMEGRMQSMAQQMEGTRANVENIAGTMGAMNHEVQAMSVEMHRMGKPARTLNNMFPFP
jgi:methyl-accepting chemotaxis protein